MVARRRGDRAEEWSRHGRLVLRVGLLSPLSYVLVLWAVRLAPLSRIAPARETSMLVAAVLGARLLGERHLARRLAGVGAILVGVIALVAG